MEVAGTALAAVTLARPSILLVDDDPRLTQSLRTALALQGFDVAVADSRASARSQLQDRAFDVVVVDLFLPDGNGIDLLVERRRDVDSDFIVITGHETVATAVAAMKKGARDYLVKPVDPSALADQVRQLRRIHALERDLRSAWVGGYTNDEHGGMVGGSPAMRAIARQVPAIASADASVFIEGESGTGKELLARVIHASSRRQDAPFVPFNCGAAAEAIVEVEFFGHDPGGAHTDLPKPGLLERAQGGTLFLDEITEMSLSMQQRLLRAIEAGGVRRNHGSERIPINVRLIASSQIGAEAAIRTGRLRSDLYFRLSAFPIRLPPLREREGDVALLAERFLALLNQAYETEKSWSPGALDELARRPWHGNVRELKNAVFRAYVLAGDHLEAERAVADPPAEGGERTRDDLQSLAHPGTTIADVERALILATLEYTGGDKPRAAALLGVSLKTIYNRLNAYKTLCR